MYYNKTFAYRLQVYKSMSIVMNYTLQLSKKRNSWMWWNIELCYCYCTTCTVWIIITFFAIVLFTWTQYFYVSWCNLHVKWFLQYHMIWMHIFSFFTEHNVKWQWRFSWVSLYSFYQTALLIQSDTIFYIFTGLGCYLSLLVQFSPSQQSSCSLRAYHPPDGRTQTWFSVLPLVSVEGCLGSTRSQRAQGLCALQNMYLKWYQSQLYCIVQCDMANTTKLS